MYIYKTKELNLLKIPKELKSEYIASKEDLQEVFSKDISAKVKVYPYEKR